MTNDYESLRKSYRPEVIRVVFIGESRPHGGTFFYRGDSRLFEYMRQAFEPCYGESENFLGFFKSLKCFLIDLCPEPVNHLRAPERRSQHNRHEPSLELQLKELQPQAVVVVMKAIADTTRRAMSSAGFGFQPYVLPFPAQGHEQEFVQCLREIIAVLIEQGLFPVPDRAAD